jgi:hypothetical protein
MRIGFAALFATGLLAACAPVPIATTYPVTLQQRMQSVSHWQVLADDVASGISEGVAPGSAPLYIAPQPRGGAFGEAFESYLATSLMRRGYAVDDTPNGAVVVNYGVERVSHRELDKRPPPGFFTALGTGVWLAHQAATHWFDGGAGTAFAAAIPLGVAVDVASMALTAPTHTEVIVTVAITSGERYVFRTNRNYYVNDRDWKEYPNAPMMLASELRIPSRPISVVGE